MTFPHAPASAGPAARAVYEHYRRELAARRRWRTADRTVTIVLVGSTLLGLASIPLALGGVHLPPLVSVSPLALTVAWLLWRDEILTVLGRPGEPRFPAQMLALALETDEAAKNPRPFGSGPPTTRSTRRESH